MRIKVILLRVIAVIMLCIGAAGTLIHSMLVFDETYMLTLVALGGSGAASRQWFYYTGFLALMIAGIVLYIACSKNKSLRK